MNLNEYIRDSVDWYNHNHVEPLRAALALCESPIETAMLWAMLRSHVRHDAYCIDHYGWPGMNCTLGSHVVELGERDAEVIPQAEVVTAEGKSYRLDFAYRAMHVRSGSLLAEAYIDVECDGHDFHERTKEQAERDKERDRDLQGLGYRIARFTGSEIARDPAECMNKLHRMIGQLLEMNYYLRHPQEKRGA